MNTDNLSNHVRNFHDKISTMMPSSGTVKLIIKNKSISQKTPIMPNPMQIFPVPINEHEIFFKCEFCLRSYNTKQSLKRHITMVHSKEFNPNKVNLNQIQQPKLLTSNKLNSEIITNLPPLQSYVPMKDKSKEEN